MLTLFIGTYGWKEQLRSCTYHHTAAAAAAAAAASALLLRAEIAECRVPFGVTTFTKLPGHAALTPRSLFTA